ncbi:hypothetical protein E2C01_018933 [Portunus trituberculatus]|uniref:Uncharacterized protein n=1 Tax=Portunus trituberculatus TaxID=210409 RepID=A0A5B7DWC7_PORTR|nr:hypothetical protein [Portunus trituberculatus]
MQHRWRRQHGDLTRQDRRPGNLCRCREGYTALGATREITDTFLGSLNEETELRLRDKGKHD